MNAFTFNKNKVHLSLTQGEPTALMLLDLSAAFDIMKPKLSLAVSDPG